MSAEKEQNTEKSSPLYATALHGTRRILTIVAIWFIFSALVFTPQHPPEYRTYAYTLKVLQVLFALGAAYTLKRSQRTGQILAWVATLLTFLDFPVGLIAGIALVVYLIRAATQGSLSGSQAQVPPNSA